MVDEFLWVAEQLASWPRLLPRPSLEVGCQLRLADAIEQLASPGRVGTGDLAILIRQVLRRQAGVGGGDLWLRVPEGPPWPSAARWLAHSVLASPAKAGGYALQAQKWSPKWLMAEGKAPPVQAAEDEAARRVSDTRQLGDGFLRDTIGEVSYTGPGQQQAMRTVLASSDTATIVINLPTGMGKSATFVVPAQLWSEGGGVTVVVVPTTALALDQERGVRAACARGSMNLTLPEHLAFHSALAEDERRTIYRGVRDGTQVMVITSPEALTTSLAPSLYAAAHAGHLRAIAIDEAHLVAQWGADFRPEFQAVAGLRADLLRIAREAGLPGFRTLLLSGTLTAEAVETLVGLFGRPGPIEVVSSVSMRAEPSYWLKWCCDEADRERLLLEAVHHLPRPLLIYTTRVDHAHAWASRLRAAGFSRVAVVTGTTPPDQRLRAIEGLTGRDLITGARIGTSVDVVVATSAFGLGIDQPDIRSVVHACVPETVDRYYQEVGRGGRDGRACFSLLLHTEDDLRTARSLNRRRIISIDRGFERWQAMRTSATVLRDDVMRVSLAARPPDLLWDSDHNEAWNLRTLTLMARAGMIELQFEQPSAIPAQEELTASHESSSAYSVIRLLRGDLADRKGWEAGARQARLRTHQADARSFALMEAALSGTSDLAEIFRSAYTMDLRDQAGVARISVLPQRSCGGCPACRSAGRTPYEGVCPRPDPIRHPGRTADDVLLGLLGGSSTRMVILTYDPDEYTSERVWLDLCGRLARSLVRHGVRNVVAPREVLQRREIQELYQRLGDRFVFLFDRYSPDELPNLPTLVVHPRLPSNSVMPWSYVDQSLDGPLRVILISGQTRDPERPDLLASLWRHPSIRAESALAAL